MAVGRKTGGRQKGSANKATRQRQQEIAATGETPLAYMLRVMRDRTVEHDRRDRMASAVAPYVHPKLTAIEHTGADGGPIKTEDVTQLSDLEVARRVALLLTKGTSKD